MGDETTTRIEWRRERDRWRGVVGGMVLFTVGYALTKDGPDGMYVVRSELPLRLRNAPTEEAAKARAERALEKFVKRIGASFASTPEEGNPNG